MLPEAMMKHLREASRVAILTGTGVATESGVPTVRESMHGHWAQYDVVDLATQQGFVRNPRLVWEWYAERRTLIEQLMPSAAHYALVDLEQFFDTFMLITQTIDGLHWRAGSRELIELHGSIMRTRCYECGNHVTSWDDDGPIPPICPYDGGWLRPDIVWLGEGLPSHELARTYRIAEHAQVFLSIGTTAQVQPAASLPLIAKRAGAMVIEINPEETALSVIADYWIQGHALEVVPELTRQLTGRTGMLEEGV
ncbi:MAG: NAD-dependent protein deacylase [Chloroflexaceae bacterium]|nr:NAD-dependent protein deacylase [Chloroflexaceae bacterium]NJL33958.1 NAD-dependent protein deacylase [Chloroflexaceae bacterium]NJO07487.1 NAD-dependent protein deacylase [Chloroflexaceae bacterium]